MNSARRMKHLNIRYFFIHDYVNNNEMIVNYVNTNDMIADILTKPLQGKRFNMLRDELLGNIIEIDEETG